MKKLLSIVASLAIVLALAGCSKEEQKPEVPVEKYSAQEVVEGVLATLELTEEYSMVSSWDLEQATNYVNLNHFNPDKEPIELTGYKSGYLAGTTRPLSTNAVIVLEFEEGTSNLEEVAKGLEDYSGVNICVRADKYESFVVENYVIYVAGAELSENGEDLDLTKHDALVKAFKEFNYVKEA